MALSVRIQVLHEIISTLSEVTSVWDICCDHGKIGAKFIETHNVFFVDKVESIIAKLHSDIPNAANYYYKDATKLNYSTDIATCFVIAGVGGELASKICDQIKPFLKDSDYILVSPHNGLLNFREALISTNFGLIAEKLVSDNGQYYEMFLINTNSNSKITPYGSMLWNENKPTCISYAQSQIDYYSIKAEFNEKFRPALQFYSGIKVSLEKD